MNPQFPLVSIVCMVKNRVGFIRRALESVLAVDYPNLEFVVQDGASDDGTLETIRSYEPKFAGRLSLVSEPDKGPEEAFFRALKRCNGSIIGSCLSDEQIMPDAPSLAVAALLEHPEAGAVFGWICATDENGKDLGIDKGPERFDLESYLTGEITPHLSASYFRKSCFEEVGLQTRDWKYVLGEFEIWTRLALRYPIVPLPAVMSKYARHTGCLSGNTKIIGKVTTGRLEFLDELFADPETPGQLKKLKAKAFAGQHIHAAWHYLAFETDSPEDARKAVLEALNYQPYPEHPLYPSFVTRLYEHGIELCNRGEYERALDFLRLVKKTRIYVKNIFLHLAVAACAVGLNLEAEEAIEWELSVDACNQEAIGLQEILKKRRAGEPLSRFELLSRAKNQAMEKFLSEKEVT